MESSIAKMTKECYEMKAGRPELERRIQDLEDKNKKAAADLQARTDKYKRLKLDRDELRKRSDEQAQSITSMKIQIQSYEKRIVGLNEHLNQYNHTPEAAHSEDPSFEFNRLQGVIDSLQEDKSDLNTEIERLQKKIEKQTGKIKGMTDELAAAKHKYDDLDHAIHAMEADKDKEIEILLAYRSEDTSIITELNIKIETFVTQVTDLTNDLEFERNIIADLKLQKVKRLGKITELEKERNKQVDQYQKIFVVKEKAESDLANTQLQYKQSQNNIAGLEARIIDLVAEVERCQADDMEDKDA